MNKKKKYRIIYISIFLTAAVLIGVLGFALFKLYKEYLPQKKEQQRYAQLRELAYSYDDSTDTDDGSSDASGNPKKPMNTLETTSTGVRVPHYTLEQLFSMNSDMVGWLTIPESEVDYPVMHTPNDPEYYLHTDFDGYYSFSGCLFIGENCDIDSESFVIYGHNMNNGSMFGNLDNYLSYSYWSSHPDIIFQTEDETRLYKVFAAFETKVYDKKDKSGAFKYYQAVGKRTQEQYDDDVDSVISLSSLDTGLHPEYPSQIVYLSTCAYHEKNGRFVVAAYRIA